MQSGGGFIIDDLSTVFDFDERGGRPAPQQEEEKHHNYDKPADSVATPKPLTSKQEAKLRSFLDGALEGITRGYRKRFDPASPLHTLTSYLAEWMRLLRVLAQVPPYGSGSTNLLISYLLRCSTDLTDGITGYSLAMEVEALTRERKRHKQQQQQQQSESNKTSGEKADGADRGPDQGIEVDESSGDEEERQHQIASRTKQLNLALQTLDLVDRIWAAVLRGNLINLPIALSNARKAFPASSVDMAAPGEEPAIDDRPNPRRPHFAPAAHLTSSLVPSPVIDGRFVSNASASASTSPRESLPIHGGRGNKTVGVTDQVRLRNIAISSRDKLFSWMRSELDAPAPPTMLDEYPEPGDPSDNTVEGALEVKQDPDALAEETEDPEEDDFEDVAIGNEADAAEEGYEAAEDTEEHRHYQDLFERKLDPDADDDDDGDDDGPSDFQGAGGAQDEESDQKLGASVLGTVEAVTNNDTHDKRKRSDDSEDAQKVEEPRADGLPSKRRRAASDAAAADTDNPDANIKMSRSELGSINFSLADASGQWDVAFTRIFSRTLRTLSDLSDFAKRGGKTDFTSSLAGISGADEQETADDRQ